MQAMILSTSGAPLSPPGENDDFEIIINNNSPLWPPGEHDDFENEQLGRQKS